MNKFDVIVVGSGFCGIQTAWMLSKLGIHVALISNSQTPLSALDNSLGVLWPSLNDPPTRAHHAHGEEVGQYLNKFCLNGIEFCKKNFSAALKAHWVKSTCIRIGAQTFEQNELHKAMELNYGLTGTENKNVFLENEASYICHSIPLFQKRISNIFKSPENTQGLPYIQGTILSLNESVTNCTLSTTCGDFSSEIVVLANGLHISKLLPKYKSILVPMSDCIFQYECPSNRLVLPISFRASSGHVAGALYQVDQKIILKITGPRYFLPQAGVGLELNSDVLNPKLKELIYNSHKQIFEILGEYLGYQNAINFANDFPFELKSSFVSTDCHPCDELPLVGEFGRLGRVLGYAGFLGTGFSAGIWAANIISDFIVNQSSSHLHPKLLPRRFFEKF